MGKAGFQDKRRLGVRKSKNGKLGSLYPLTRSHKCPECASQHVWKDGLRYTKQGDVQRWLCRACGYRFSDSKVKIDIIKQSPILSDTVHDLGDLDFINLGLDKIGFKDSALTFGKDVGSHDFTITGKTINNFPHNRRKRQVCVSEREAKNLSQQNTRQKQVAGATKLSEIDIKGKLVEFMWFMKKHGYAKSTIRSRGKLLKRLVNLNANLCDPENVKKAIAEQSWCEGRKSNACDTYTTFLKMLGRTWDRPIYKSISKLPFIPAESEIDQLIAGCSTRMACFLQLLKETGMRPGEAWQLTWTDMDLVTKTVRVTPEKRSNPRIFHMSAKLASMLEALPRNYGNRLFSTPSMPLGHHGDHFGQQRRRIAYKLKNPRLLRITFKTFRHWKATMEYHRTKDIVHVQHVLGHRNINNTMVYITLAEELFKDQQEYVSKVAKNVKEACALADAGFEYVTGEYNDGGKIFRKPKCYA